MKLKIVYIIDNEHYGGGERVFLQIASRLNKDEFEPIFICAPQNPLKKNLNKLKIRLIPFNFGFQHKLNNIYKLYKILKTEKPQIVHTQGSRVDFYGCIASWAAKINIIIFTVAMPIDNFDINKFKMRIYLLFYKIPEKIANKIIVISDSVKDILLKNHKINPKKICLIRNGIDTQEYYYSELSRQKIRDEFHCNDKTILIGTIGRLVYQKGISYYVKSTKKIFQTEKNIKFIIVGEGEKRIEIEKLISDLKVKENVILTGFRNDIKEIISALDIFVLSSVTEGMPMIVLEVMAMGKAMVLTKIPGVEEIVKHLEDAVCVSACDPNGLAEGMLLLMRDQKLASQLGVAARKSAEIKYDVSKVISEHEKLYFDLNKRACPKVKGNND